MLSLTPAVRIFLAAALVDMRNSIDGLMAIVRNQWSEDVLSGHLFVFVSRRCDRVKIITWGAGGSRGRGGFGSEGVFGGEGGFGGRGGLGGLGDFGGRRGLWGAFLISKAWVRPDGRIRRRRAPAPQPLRRSAAGLVSAAPVVFGRGKISTR